MKLVKHIIDRGWFFLFLAAGEFLGSILAVYYDHPTRVAIIGFGGAIFLVGAFCFVRETKRNNRDTAP